MKTFRWAGWRDEAKKKSGGKRDGQSLCWTLFLAVVLSKIDLGSIDMWKMYVFVRISVKTYQ